MAVTKKVHFGLYSFTQISFAWRIQLLFLVFFSQYESTEVSGTMWLFGLQHSMSIYDSIHKCIKMQVTFLSKTTKKFNGSSPFLLQNLIWLGLKFFFQLRSTICYLYVTILYTKVHWDFLALHKQIKHIFVLLHYSKYCVHALRLRTEEVFWKRSIKRTHPICYSTEFSTLKSLFFWRCGCR